MQEIKNMNMIKKNDVDESRVYISTYYGHDLVLKLPNQTWVGKIIIYVYGNLGYENTSKVLPS